MRPWLAFAALAVLLLAIQLTHAAKSADNAVSDSSNRTTATGTNAATPARVTSTGSARVSTATTDANTDSSGTRIATTTGTGTGNAATTGTSAVGTTVKTPTISEAVETISQQTVGRLTTNTQANTAARTTGQNAVTARNAVAIRSNYGSALKECQNGTTSEARVTCRLAAASATKNTDAGRVPEECKLKAENSARSACFAKYEKQLKCADENTTDGRENCLHRELGTTANVQASVRNCADSKNQTDCTRQVRQQVVEAASARLTGLQEAARKLTDRGIDATTTDSFVASMEQHRSRLQSAQTAEEKKQIVSKVQSQWKAFKQSALETLRAANAGGEAQ